MPTPALRGRLTRHQPTILRGIDGQCTLIEKTSSASFGAALSSLYKVCSRHVESADVTVVAHHQDTCRGPELPRLGPQGRRVSLRMTVEQRTAKAKRGWNTGSPYPSTEDPGRHQAFPRLLLAHLEDKGPRGLCLDRMSLVRRHQQGQNLLPLIPRFALRKVSRLAKSTRRTGLHRTAK